MKGTRYTVLGVTAFVTLILGLLAVVFPSNQAQQERFMQELRRDLLTSRQVLEEFAKVTLAMGTEPSAQVDFSDIRDTAIGRRIRNVTRAANGSLYFILGDSTVTSDVGLVLRVGGSEFLGDQQEPEVDHTERIDGDWYYYHAW